MKSRTPISAGLCPPLSRLKWWIAGSILLLLAGWEVVSHQWLMDLPMVMGHWVNTLVSAALTVGAVWAYLVLVHWYEERLAEGATILWEVDQTLRERVAARNTSLLELARELEGTLSAVRRRCEETDAASTGTAATEALHSVAQSATAAGCAVHTLRNVIAEGETLANLVPGMLERYRCCGESTQT